MWLFFGESGFLEEGGGHFPSGGGDEVVDFYFVGVDGVVEEGAVAG